MYVYVQSGHETEMIHRIENGSAMGNSAEEIKKKAKYIIGYNNTDSIYNLLIKKGIINE